MSAPPPVIAIRGRGQTYGVVAGVVAGMLVAGLLVPLVFGTSIAQRRSSRAAGSSGTALNAGGPAEAAGPAIAESGPAGAAAGVGAGTASASLGGLGTGSPTARAGVGGPGAVARTTGGGPGGAGLTATDRGVTPTTIKLGIVLLDLATAHSVGLAPDNYEVATQQKAFQIYVDDMNHHGGINGRQVQAFYATVDPFQSSTASTACRTLTDDDGVFAVLAMPGYTGSDPMCIARDHRTPTVISSGWSPREFFDAAAGYLISDLQIGERMMLDWVGVLDQLGSLKGRKIGILGDDSSANGDKQDADGLVAALKQFGYSVTYRSHLPADLQNGAQQIPLEVQQMRSAIGENGAVLMPTNFPYAVPFARDADSQGWHPSYFTSDLGGLTADALVENMPDSFDGSIGVTAIRLGIHEARAGEAEPAVAKSCRELYNRSTDGKQFAWGDTDPLLWACEETTVFRAAAQMAGPTLNRAGYVGAVQRLGTIELPAYYGGSYGPGKFDYVDFVRPLRWVLSCKCYKLAGPAQRVRY